jgi:glycosyltransferase involved in cell wall biosynthesis
MKKEKVLIVYHYIAQYRQPVFDELNNYENFDFTFMSDKISKGNIKTIDESFFSDKNFIPVKNVWFKNFLWQKDLISHVIKNKYNSVIFLADPYFITTWIASFILKIKKTKVLFWTHGFIRGNSGKDKLKLLFYKFCDGILLYGDKAKSNLVNNNIDSEKLFPIYNSLNYDIQKKLREELTNKEIDKSKYFKNPNLQQIIFIGRLTKQKKLDILIKLLKKLNEKNLNLNLLFVGDGSEKSNLENLISQYHLDDQVFFYGKTYNEEEIAPLILNSDLCISPGEIGLTAMHVLAYGTPVITHNNEFNQMPEYESIIDGYSGKLYEYGSFESLVNTTFNFFNNPIENIRENCINIIEKKYTPKAQSKLIIEAINAISK